jgi:hypothetical protein
MIIGLTMSPEFIALVASAIEKADATFGYSVRLTRLVEDEATYTLTYPDQEEALEFRDMDEAHEHIRARQCAVRAEAVLAALITTR